VRQPLPARAARRASLHCSLVFEYLPEEFCAICGAINHICEHFSLLHSCCLYVDQKLMISAYQSQSRVRRRS
jgi:hypothetical protein